MIGTLVELFHDDKGIIWPKAVAPYQVHLIEIGKDASPIYKTLEKEGIEVLYDDRDVSVGQKFADADLIGIPARLVVSAKNEDKIEWKERASEKTEMLDLEEVLKRLKKVQAL